MDMLLSLKEYSLWGNTAYDYAIAFGIFVGLIIVLKIFQLIILGRLKKLAQKTTTDLDDALIDYISTIKPPFYLVISLLLSIQYMTMPDWVGKTLFFLFVIFLVYEAVRAGEKIIGFAIEAYGRKQSESYDPKQSRTIIHITKLIVRIVLWSIGLLMILSNLGVNVSSLIASLGIGGIAIALAVQNILSDMFSSFSLYLDKPFEVGDFIVLGTDSGTVQKIGLKTTRIKTLRGEELVVSNKELTTVRVQNLKKLKRRREVFTFGVTYETDQKKLEQIPAMVEEIVTSVGDVVEFDRSHLALLGPSSVDFETVYHLDTSDYGVYMDIKQQIHLALLKKFKAEDIEFAYPTQTLKVDKDI